MGESAFSSFSFVNALMPRNTRIKLDTPEIILIAESIVWMSSELDVKNDRSHGSHQRAVAHARMTTTRRKSKRLIFITRLTSVHRRSNYRAPHQPNTSISQPE